MAGVATLAFYLYQTAYNILMALLCIIAIMVILTVIVNVVRMGTGKGKR